MYLLMFIIVRKIVFMFGGLLCICMLLPVTLQLSIFLYTKYFYSPGAIQIYVQLANQHNRGAEN